MALNIQEIIGKFTSLFSKGSSAGDGNATLKQVIVPIIGLLLFMAIAFYAIQKLRVNGPLFKEVIDMENLRSDVLPPPLYVVEAFASANSIYIALISGDEKGISDGFDTKDLYEQSFLDAQKKWQANNNAKVPKALMGEYNALIKSGESFFTIYNTKFVPAVDSHSADTALAALSELKQAYLIDRNNTNTLTFNLQSEATKLSDHINSLLKYFLIGLTLLGAAIAIALYVFGKKQAKATDDAIKLLETDGQNNQLAVLDLLDEMGDLSEGDLTVRAQVKENITGAIADSINYTIDSLRDVVTEINRASEQVNTATGAAQSTSTALLEAAEMQSQQIMETTEAVTGMTTSIQQVSSNANQAAQVAQRSLQAATQGSQAVQNTIAGMNGIREQIQETSKRIKRLGESSQEIGEIVELISDITEQTNILALNAAIQAASAGEAGRGFTVVAEEVQRLAERSSEATKQISAIVKTIQTDTNSAVAAMEKSTEGVVEGARLSDAAGQALTEIETVTNNLARLIQSISSATEAQNITASQVAKNMEQIQEITTLTTQGTKQTAESVGQLTTLAGELRQSVAGFKLS